MQLVVCMYVCMYVSIYEQLCVLERKMKIFPISYVYFNEWRSSNRVLYVCMYVCMYVLFVAMSYFYIAAFIESVQLIQ